MANIIVEKLCGCAKKRENWKETVECSSVEEAKTLALKMCEEGNTKFCKKHTFSTIEDNGNILIKVDMKK